MKTLVESLTQETQDLKADYLKQVAEWADARFESIVKIKGWGGIEWCKYFNLEPRIVNAGKSTEFLGMPDGFYNTKNHAVQHRMVNEANRVSRKGRVLFISEQ